MRVFGGESSLVLDFPLRSRGFVANTVVTSGPHAFGKVFADMETPAIASPTAKEARPELLQPNAPLSRTTQPSEPQTVSAQEVAAALALPKGERLGAVVALLDRDPRQLNAIIKTLRGHLESLVNDSPAAAFAERGKLIEHVVNGRAAIELVHPLFAAIAQRADRPLEAKVGDDVRLMATLAMVANEPARFVALTAAIAPHVPLADIRDYYRAIADEQGGSLAVLGALDKIA